MKNGQRPEAALLHDPYAGHRDPDDIFWRPDPLLHTQWTRWDYALAEAVNAMDSLTSQTGQPLWLAEDPEVYWEIGESVDFSMQTLAEEQARYKDGVPRELMMFVKNPTKTGDKPFWTIDEWLAFRESQVDGASTDRGVPEGARPPTPEELDQLRRDREARIAAKWAEAAED